jgi:6,7-dimethyl-8-ribityllumazine synthase
MASKNKNLSDVSGKNLTDISLSIFSIVVSEWNDQITDALYDGAYQTLM